MHEYKTLIIISANHLDHVLMLLAGNEMVKVNHLEIKG